jgi:alpha-1,2-mannosyltransferase
MGLVTRKRLHNLVLVLLLALGVYLWQRTVFPVYTGDLFPDQLGAYYWEKGEYSWIYAPVDGFQEWHAHSLPIARNLGHNCDLGPFMYPPFVAAILSPFANLSATAWRAVLFGINFLLLFVLAYEIVRLLRAKLTLHSFLWVLVPILLCYPVARATELSQIVPLLAALTWVGLLWMRQSKDWQAGVLVGIVAAVKLFPLVLLALPLFDRRLRVLAIALATAVIIYVLSITTLGTQVHLYWWETMEEFGRLVNPYYGNQSLLGWAARVVFGNSGTWGLPVAIPGLTLFRVGLPVLFGGLSALALWRLKDHLVTEQLALSSGLVLSAVLLSVPTAWEHYWIFVLPSLVWAIYETVQRRDAGMWEIWLGVASFFFLMKLTHFSYADTLFSKLMSGSQTFGMLLLWIWLLRRAWQEKWRPHVLQTA